MSGHRPHSTWVEQLSLHDFRCFAEVAIDLAPGATLVVGANGEGKTTLLEAAAWCASGRSFRGAPDAAVVRRDAARAYLHCSLRIDERIQSIDVEISAQGANRILLNGTRIARRRELSEVMPCSVFTPDDLELVKGGPAGRREYLDDLLVVLAPRYEAARSDYERVLRHRNALLRSGVHGPDDETTLAVFDEQLASAGGELLRGRLRLAARLEPMIVGAYEALAGSEARIRGDYQAEYAEGPLSVADAERTEDLLRAALVGARRRERDRGVSLVGPHRDDWALQIGGLSARLQASQGEQRSLALALRLAGHQLVTEVTGTRPLLLLDDVFSELDDQRAGALVEQLPAGQTLITTAGTVPPTITVERRYEVVDGAVRGA